jgi:hypothetical protein
MKPRSSRMRHFGTHRAGPTWPRVLRTNSSDDGRGARARPNFAAHDYDLVPPCGEHVCDLSSDSVGSVSDYRDGRHPMRRFSSALCDRSIAFATNAGSSHIGK